MIAERWIIACLRNRRFFTLRELNAAIAELLSHLNQRRFKKLSTNSTLRYGRRYGRDLTAVEIGG